MSRVIVTAQVEDSAKWEQGFHTHKELFSEYTATSVRYGMGDQNQVAILWEVDDLDKYVALMDSSATQQAMTDDGVKVETVRTFVLDKQVDL